MTPRIRKAALTAHVISSVGWLGAVAVSLVLTVVGLASQDDQTVRAVLLALKPVTWFVVIPLSVASLVTGIVSALGTTWGLLRHYWVLFKLVLNLVATIVLLMYTQTINFTGVVAARTLSGPDLRALGASPAIHSGAALLVLVVATVLAVYKPRGRTRYGVRKQNESRHAGLSSS